MNRRRLILLVIGVVLLLLGVGLFFYGNSLPPNIVVQNLALTTFEVNIIMLIGVPPICVGTTLLLLWFVTRPKSARLPLEKIPD